jgi:MATE family multidrug resistance protein
VKESDRLKQTYTRSQKILLLTQILIPILLTQLGMFSMNFFDTTMSGKYSENDLAGVAIGSSFWVPIFTGLSGILLSVTPIVAQLNGANQKKEIAKTVLQGIYAALCISVLVFLLGIFFLDPLLNKMNLDSSVRRIAFEFLKGISFGIVPLFVYNVLRSYMEALGKTRVTMLITLSALPINILFNYLLIFGNLGFPELGGVGAGYASAITYWVIMILAVLVVKWMHPFTEYHLFSKWVRVDYQKWKEMLKIGVPIGLSIFFETSIFSAVTLFMSEYSTVVIASHQSAINFASFLYMIPLSISMALTIVVGYETGSGRFQDAKSYSYIGIALALLLASMYGMLLYSIRFPIASIYTKNPEVLALTSHFLLYAVFFQLSDAIQAPVQGALRGYKDVNVTFIMSLISYWVVGLPLGYLLAKYTSFGPFGYWIGLISGLTVGALTLTTRLRIVQKRLLINNKNQLHS